MRTFAVGSLTLEPQVAAHAEEMFAVLSDPAIYEFENEPPPSLMWLRERYARLESRRSDDGREQWLDWFVYRAPRRSATFRRGRETASYSSGGVSLGSVGTNHVRRPGAN